MTPIIITAPTKLPISTDEMMSHLRIDEWAMQGSPPTIAEEDLAENMIAAARDYYESRTWRTVHDTTLELALESFPAGPIILPRAAPLTAVVSIKYRDSAGAESTVDTATYIVDTDSEPGRVVLAYNKTWPSFTAYPSLPIRIRYRAGLASSPEAEADGQAKLAILVLVAELWQIRDVFLDNPTAAVGRVANRVQERFMQAAQKEWVF